MKQTIHVVLGFVLALSMGSGCCTLVHSGKRQVAINSEPSGALVTITDRKGDVIATDRTPFIAKLSPGGPYFRGYTYTAAFKLDGFQDSTVTIHAQLSGLYFGNFLFGGFPGFLIIDPLTGAMYNLWPRFIDEQLERLPAPIIQGSGTPPASTNVAVPSTQPPMTVPATH